MQYKIVYYLVVLLTIISCAPSKVQEEKAYEFKLKNASFPLVLKGMSFSDFTAPLQDQEHEEFIEQSIKKYCSDNKVGSEASAYKGTLQLQYKAYSIYVNIFKHPSGLLNANYLIAKKDSLLLANKAYNIHAMYTLKSDTLLPTNLYTTFVDGLADISVKEREGVSCLQSVRLIHNGTLNQLEVFDHPLQQGFDFYKRTDTIGLTTKNLSVKSYTDFSDFCLENYIGGVFYAKEKSILPLGDYNGDQLQDTLIASISLEDKNRDTIIILQYGQDYAAWQKWAHTTAYDLVLSSTTMESLRLRNKKSIAGLALACNVGNVNKVPGDELLLMFFMPQPFSIRPVFLLSYAKGEWGVLCEWEVNMTVDLNEQIAIKAINETQLMIKALNAETMTQDSLLPIDQVYQENHYFEIE